MPRRRRKPARWKRRVPFFLGVSLLAHAGLLLSLPSRIPAQPVSLEIQIAGSEGRGPGGSAANSEVSTAGAGRPITAALVRLPAVVESRTSSALDRGVPGLSRASGGRISVLLADRDQGITVAEQLANNLAVTQFQRIATARDRSSLIDDRLTPHPSDDTLLLSGRGRLREMLRPRATTGARGVAEEPEATASTPSEGRPVEANGSDGSAPHRADPPAAADGRAPEVELRQGIPGGTAAGTAISSGGSIAHTRPDLHQGRPATPSEDRQGRPRDNRWSELLVSTFDRGYVTASDPGGGQGSDNGAGSGGRGAGRSGRGDGGRSAAGAGAGDETWISLNTPDPRFMAFFRDIHRRVDPLWQRAFPHEAEMQLEQGMCIIGFTVHRDGHITGIHVRRRSGFPEFDRRVQDALRQAAPFGPIPSSLGVDRLLVTAPFEFSNPMFR